MKYKIGDTFKVIKAYEDLSVGDIVTATCLVKEKCNEDGSTAGYPHFTKKGSSIEVPMHYDCEGKCLRHPFTVIDEVEPVINKVRIRKGWGKYGNLKEGSITTVIKVTPMHYDCEGKCLSHPFTVIDEVEPVIKRRFKIGDKVRIRKGWGKYGNLKEGSITTVIKVTPNDYTIADGDDFWYAHDDLLELVTEEKQDNIFNFSVGLDTFKWDDPQQQTKSGEERQVRKNMALIMGERYVPKKGARCSSWECCNDAAYVIITETREDNGYTGYFIYNKENKIVSSCSSCFNESNLEPYNPGHKKGLMGKLSQLATKLLDADTKAFVEAGILDSELKLTEEGRDFVLTQVLNDNKKEYATEARKIISEAKKEKECK